MVFKYFGELLACSWKIWFSYNDARTEISKLTRSNYQCYQICRKACPKFFLLKRDCHFESLHRLQTLWLLDWSSNNLFLRLFYVFKWVLRNYRMMRETLQITFDSKTKTSIMIFATNFTIEKYTWIQYALWLTWKTIFLVNEIHGTNSVIRMILSEWKLPSSKRH